MFRTASVGQADLLVAMRRHQSITEACQVRRCQAVSHESRHAQGFREAGFTNVVQHPGVLDGGVHHGVGPYLQGRARALRNLAGHPQWGNHNWCALVSKCGI